MTGITTYCVKITEYDAKNKTTSISLDVPTPLEAAYDFYFAEVRPRFKEAANYSDVWHAADTLKSAQSGPSESPLSRAAEARNRLEGNPSAEGKTRLQLDAIKADLKIGSRQSVTMHVAAH